MFGFKNNWIEVWSQSYQTLFFFVYRFSPLSLSVCNVWNFFIYCETAKSNIIIFGRIDSWMTILYRLTVKWSSQTWRCESCWCHQSHHLFSLCFVIIFRHFCRLCLFHRSVKRWQTPFLSMAMLMLNTVNLELTTTSE